jgi:hypothetical protein
LREIAPSAAGLTASSDSLLEFKLDFVKIICDYEHFIQLNLPYGSNFFQDLPATSSESIISCWRYLGMLLSKPITAAKSTSCVGCCCTNLRHVGTAKKKICDQK